MKQKQHSISGVTLIEILIGIVISTIMMGAMFVSYTAVNNSYGQVSDKAKISQSSRILIGMIVKDVRMAGFKYFNDTIKTTDEHIPILITKSKDFKKECDKIEIVYGDMWYDNFTKNSTYERFKVSYFCEKSKIIDKNKSGSSTVYVDAFAVYKEKVKWDVNKSDWADPETDKLVLGGGSLADERTYSKEKVVDYIEDLIFHPIDEKGKLITPPPTVTNSNKDLIYKIKTVDISVTKRSKKEFYRENKYVIKKSLEDTKRDINKTDKYLRETIIISASTRNLGLL